ncbi:MAG: NAD(P)/FAD-dependent oxidoreductase [Firmicutes bacterium]|nr:NAD(P)/FAD-dependent oxidoreductase [Bacillota bacterium]
MNYALIVIGGGPAGMLAAATAAAGGRPVLLLDKNEKLGKKLYLTGKGRCNVTNYGDLDDYLAHIVTNKKFLYSALKSFTNRQLITLLESLGLKTKVERGNRVFPRSDKSSDVIKALQKHLAVNKVEVRLHTPVKNIMLQEGRAAGVLLNDGQTIRAEKVLLATGGLSYRQTGSTGDGYRMALEAGHSLVPAQPALVPLVTAEAWVKDLQGLSLKNVAVQAAFNNKVLAEQSGEMLFTHFGVSGPVILSLSSYIKPPHLPARLSIDLKPALTFEQLDTRLQRDFNRYPAKHLKNSLDDLLPQKLIPVVLAQSGLAIHKPVIQLSKKERSRLVQTLKDLALTVTGPRPLNEAIITSGGVDVREINPSTMESKIIRGLYFAGEIIDVDALTGGYNLQIAFSTGYLAGLSAAASKNTGAGR